jgi:hypothetical protein
MTMEVEVEGEGYKEEEDLHLVESYKHSEHEADRHHSERGHCVRAFRRRDRCMSGCTNNLVGNCSHLDDDGVCDLVDGKD